MPHTLINGLDVHYEVLGEGQPLLFLNGSGSTIADVRPLLRTFARHVRVAIADSRGMGRTEVPATPYTMADLACDAIELADHLGWRTFDVVGISFGGMVAQELAVTAPSRIRRLVLVCTSSGGPGGASYPLDTLARLDPERRAAISTQILDTRFTEEWLVAHPGDRALVQLMAERRGNDPGAAARRGTELQLRARAGHDVFDRLPRITSPTLVASGRFDGIAPPENGAAIAAQIATADLRLYDGGHLFFQQDPTALPDVLEFLGAREA